KRIPEIRESLAAASGHAVANLIATRMPWRISFADGESVDLTWEELLVDTQQLPGFAVAEEGGYVVALETTLTPELVREGLARDFVRFVQEARKNAGLRIEDRIRTTYHAPAEGEVAAAIADFAEFIKGETLSLELTAGEPGGGAYQETFSLGGEDVTVGISRVEES